MDAEKHFFVPKTHIVMKIIYEHIAAVKVEILARIFCPVIIM